MIKNATFFRISNLPATFGQDTELTAFEPCGPTQEKSVGWTPPRGEDHGALIESVNGQVVLKLMTEVRKVPAQTLADEVKRRADDIEKTTGRKPGKKEKREIADDAKLALLPMAFTARSATTVIIDPASKLVLVDSTTTGKVDEVLTALVKSVDGIAISQIATNTSPSSAMAMWLMTKESPNSFTVDRECELKASDESKAVVKYGRHPLDIDEVAQHIAQGKIPTKLALTWNDRVSFVLTSSMQLKKLAFLDCVFENRGDTEADAFDADVCIVTGEMSSLFVNLVEVLGGELIESVSPEATPAHHHTSDGEDPMYDQAVEVVLKNRKGSISLVQRHLKIGYNHAARLLEDMEKRGIVSAMQSSGHREVLA